MVPTFDGHIENLLPHRGPMLLVDRLVSDDAEGVRVEAVVRRGAPFVEDRGLPSWASIELMAQAVGTWAGLRRLEANDSIRLGFLLGTRRFEASVSHFPVGAVLEIAARRELVTDEGLAVFACEISFEGRVVATANLNAFQPSDVEGYLRSLSS